MAIAEVLEFEVADPAAQAELTMHDAIGLLGTLSDQAALALSDRFQSQLQAFDAEAIAGCIASGANPRQAEDLAGRGTTRTSAEAKRRAGRARAVHINPDLGRELATGELGSAGLDAIASAADRSDGVAATDIALIETIKASNPDDARKIASD
ncbi:MAG: hypothetical protein HKN01_08620 [Acidimicrobiia bacterium]|nr:hypothetical protein [Acidimicrobiia bacterium]